MTSLDSNPDRKSGECLKAAEDRRLIAECDARVLAQWRRKGLVYAANVVEALKRDVPKRESGATSEWMWEREQWNRLYQEVHRVAALMARDLAVLAAAGHGESEGLEQYQIMQREQAHNGTEPSWDSGRESSAADVDGAAG